MITIKMNMKILITEPEFFSVEKRKEFESLGEVIARKMNRQELLKIIVDIDILIIRVDTKVDKELIDCAKKLKIIATPITGTDHIDMEYAEKMGIKIISAPGMNANTTAEHTFAMILALAKKIPFAFEHVKNNKWNRHEYISNELKEKTLGIIGLGRIGSRIAEFAAVFGMNVIAYDKYVTVEDGKKRGAEIVEFDELLERSDIISVHCVLTEETKNMFCSEAFLMMKENAMLVNASRGEVIDESALLDALKNKKISGAALDVLTQEPPVDSKLVEYAKHHENLIITPHIAGLSYESINDALSYIIGKIKESIK
ncbi:MAG: hydroxyacid dehydrogenase [Candidatus Aenigmatarchaeota archaeon]